MEKKDQPRQPVEYLVKEKSLIGNEIHEAGAKVLYDGLPAENLEPTCDEGRARYQEYLDSNKKRVAAMVDQNSTSAVGDPAAFAKALAEHQAGQSEMISKAISEGISAGIALALSNAGVPAPDAAAPADTTAKDTTKGGKGDKKGDSLV